MWWWWWQWWWWWWWWRPRWWCCYTVMRVMMSGIAERTPHCKAVCKPTRLKPPAESAECEAGGKRFWEARFEKGTNRGRCVSFAKNEEKTIKDKVLLDASCFPILPLHVGSTISYEWSSFISFAKWNEKVKKSDKEHHQHKVSSSSTEWLTCPATRKYKIWKLIQLMST